MLVHCPKCHFEQPKDTYCAKCGIEMESFKPEKTPVWKSILSNPFFHIIIFVVFGFWSYQRFILNKSDKNFYAHQDSNQSQTHQKVLNESTDQTDNSDEAKPELKFDAAQLNSKEVSTHTNHKTPSGNTAAANTPVTPNSEIHSLEKPHLNGSSHTNLETATTPSTHDESSATAESNIISKGPWTLNVKYVEVKNSDLRNLINVNPNNEVASGESITLKILKNDPLFKSIKWTSLDQSTLKSFKGKNNNKWFVGAQEPESNSAIGLNLKVQLNPLSEKGDIQGEIEIQRTLYEIIDGNSGTQKNQINFTFDMNPNEAFLIAGLFPHKKPIGENRNMATDTRDLNWMKDSLLKIFFSNSFLRNESEFVIIFEFQPTP